MTTLRGYDAINYAEANGLTLNKYNDPIEDAREGLSVDKARKVAAEDPQLIYVEANAAVSALLARMGGKVLVIDPVTDADETAESCEVRPVATKYSVTFRKEFNESGEGIDYPTDFFRVPDGVIEDMAFIEMRPPANSEYGEEEWQYEVDTDRVSEFESAADRCETAVRYNRLTTEPETITDPALIRALYDHPSAKSYGDGSYTVEE